MKLLLFSDLHRDREAARSLFEIVQREAIDVAIGAGDFATCRNGLSDTLEILHRVPCPLVVVAGNAESDEELRAVCGDWDHVHVLHGDSVTLHDRIFFGLGGAVPVTPFGSWSFDLDESTAAAMLAECPRDAVLVTHAPPWELADRASDGRHLGSRAIRECIDRCVPRLAVCGHIHDSWGCVIEHGATTVINAGPQGLVHTL